MTNYSNSSSDSDYSSDQGFVFPSFKSIESLKTYVDQNGIECREGSFNDTLLILCCKKNQFKYIKYLVENGANVNANNDSNSTPLLYTVMHDNAGAFKLLLEHGADYKYDSGRYTALHWAVGNSEEDESEEDESILDLLLSYPDIDVNAPDGHGHTPLMLADNSIAIQKLLDHGADMNISYTRMDDNWNKIKVNALTHHAYYSHLDSDIIECLLNAGAKFNIKHEKLEYLQQAFNQKPLLDDTLNIIKEYHTEEKGPMYDDENEDVLTNVNNRTGCCGGPRCGGLGGWDYYPNIGFHKNDSDYEEPEECTIM